MRTTYEDQLVALKFELANPRHEYRLTNTLQEEYELLEKLKGNPNVIRPIRYVNLSEMTVKIP